MTRRQETSVCFQCFDAGRCDFFTLDDEVLVKEVAVCLMLVEVLGCQHGRQDWDIDVELDTHESVDDGCGDEVVAVDPAVHYKPSRNDRCVSTGGRKSLRHQWQFQGADRKSVV